MNNNIQIHTEPERGVLAFLEEHYKGKKSSIEPFKLTAIRQLKNGNATYDVNLNAGTTGSSQKGIEARLPANDVFVPFAYSVHLAKVEDANTADLSGNSILYTYPDNAAFPMANEARSLMTVFHGKMKLVADNVNLYQDIPIRPCYKVPLVQLDAGAAFASQDYSRNKIFLRTSKAISGQKNNKLEIRLGQGDFSTLEGDTSSGSQNFVIIDLHGYIIRSATESQATESLMQKCNL